MRLNKTSIAAVGAVMLPIDPHQQALSDAVIIYGSSSIDATAQLDGTYSELSNQIPMTFSRSTTTVTVTTVVDHTLGSNVDYVLITGTGVASIDGFYPVATVTTDLALTYTSGTSATTVGSGFITPIRRAQAVIASGVMAATIKTPTVTAANPFYTIPYSALILKCTVYAAGTIYLDVRQSGSSY